MRALARLLIPVVAAVAATAVIVPSASAHERRTVIGYDLVVGYGNEPVYAGEPNFVDFAVSKGDKPVNAIGEDLDVTVIYGDLSTEKLEIKPKFKVGGYGTPGEYGANFIPTRSGTYTFHFTGAINGKPIDEKFTSSDTTFGNVINLTENAFPAKDPSAADLATKLTTTTKKLDDAQSAATTARLLGLAGLLVALAALGLTLARGKSRTVAPEQQPAAARV